MEAILETPDNLVSLVTAKVHVGNIGRSSVAGEALRLMFEKVLPQMDNVNTIVIMVGASAVLSWLQQGTPSLPRCGDLDLNDYFMKHPAHPFSFSPGHMALIELARRVRDKRKPVKVRDDVGKWLIKAREMRLNAPDLRTATPDPTPVIDNFAHLRGLVGGYKAEGVAGDHHAAVVSKGEVFSEEEGSSGWRRET
jgi:hypothetical protein